MSRNLSLVLIFIFIVLGPCAVFAVSSFASIKALGRNPSAAPKIFTGMVISLVVAFFLAFIAMMIVFQLFSNE